MREKSRSKEAFWWSRGRRRSTWCCFSAV